MARRLSPLICLALAGFFALALPAGVALAATSPTPTPVAKPSPPPVAQPKPTKPGKQDDWTDARKLFEQLSPDQQKKFLDNLDQWKSMSPEEQELFRDRELFRQQKIAQEIQQAITKSGLKLGDDEREVYALRYTQERRKIEDALRKEADTQRQIMVNEMVARLKTEFASGAPAIPKVQIAPIK